MVALISGDRPGWCGMDNIDVAYAREKGIHVFNTGRFISCCR